MLMFIPYFFQTFVELVNMAILLAILQQGDLVSKETVCCVGGKVKH